MMTRKFTQDSQVRSNNGDLNEIKRPKMKNVSHFRLLAKSNFSTSGNAKKIALVGLGQMGSKIAKNWKDDGDKKFVVFDLDKERVRALAGLNISVANSLHDVAGCDVVVSILPNDKAVSAVSEELLKILQPGSVHIGCSTIAPSTSQKLEKQFNAQRMTYIAAPVFARPDGLLKRQATWLVSGDDNGRQIATDLLQSLGKVVDFGRDVGAANVVKLCGNFLIACSIESIAETMAFAEKNGVDREAVMKLLSSTIFDCLIYKGYGDRVSKRDHRPGGFSLELGYKDVSLVQQAAKEVAVPMPYLSVLVDRFLSASAKDRGSFDWSAIGLNAAEDAGIDVTKDIVRIKDDIATGNTY